MKENDKNITTGAKASANTQKSKDLLVGAGKVGQIMSSTAHAVADSANAVTKISEHLNEREDRFMERHRSRARDLRHRVIEDIIDKDDISPDEKLKYIMEYQDADTDETVRLLEAHAASNKAQGSKGLKIGAGVGAGAIGTGILIWILNGIFGGHGNDKTA